MSEDPVVALELESRSGYYYYFICKGMSMYLFERVLVECSSFIIMGFCNWELSGFEG